jgi:putative flippase GtrA
MIQKLKMYISEKGLGEETIRYIVVGGLTTLINFVVFALMHEVMRIDVTISNVTSISISIIFAYIANKLAVFMSHCKTRSELMLEFVKFVGSRLFTMVLEVGIVLLFAEILKINATLGKAVSVVLVVIINYFISKLIVFKRSHPSDKTPEVLQESDPDTHET